MGSLPRAEAGVGSATSDTSMQVGGALGVAVLGTALNMHFHDAMAPFLAHQPVPPNVAALIEGSLGGALAVAGHLPAAYAAPLRLAARHGFISGMDLGLLVAAVMVAAAAVMVAFLLPARATEPARSPQDPSAPTPSGGRNLELVEVDEA